LIFPRADRSITPPAARDPEATADRADIPFDLQGVAYLVLLFVHGYYHVVPEHVELAGSTGRRGEGSTQRAE
jgi:hypothetical protein